MRLHSLQSDCWCLSHYIKLAGDHTPSSVLILCVGPWIYQGCVLLWPYLYHFLLAVRICKWKKKRRNKTVRLDCSLVLCMRIWIKGQIRGMEVILDVQSECSAKCLSERWFFWHCLCILLLWQSQLWSHLDRVDVLVSGGPPAVTDGSWCSAACCHTIAEPRE